MEKRIHKGCSCFMCKHGKRSKYGGDKRLDIVERRYRRATKAALDDVTHGKTSPEDFIIQLSATGYTG